MRTPEQICQIADWMGAGRIGTLELVEDSAVLRLTAGGPNAGPAPPAGAANPSSTHVTPVSYLTTQAMGRVQFYSPGEPTPLADPGQVVQVGQLVALLEADGFLAPVFSQTACRIARVLVTSGEIVGWGDRIFEVDPLDSHA